MKKTTQPDTETLMAGVSEDEFWGGAGVFRKSFRDAGGVQGTFSLVGEFRS